MDLKRFDWNFFLKKETRLYRHLVFWTLVVLWHLIFITHPKDLSTPELICRILQLTLKLAIPGYINNYLVLPFFRKKKIVIGVILFITEIVVLTFLVPLVLELIRQFFVVFFHIESWIEWNSESFTFNIIAYVMLASIFKYAKDSLVHSKEQKEAELRHLKNQLNPHFLFNTLNNLYGLAVNKSNKLPPLMLQLSELLRYSVYDTQQTLVPLEKELSYLKNYVEFEKIRLNENVTINFDYSGDFSNVSIAPLILIVFIENSFKHVSYKRKEQGLVGISLSLHDNDLYFSTNNSLDPILFEEQKNNREHGVGLKNVKKRLDILYAQKYQIKIDHQPNYYDIQLKIDLGK